MLTTVDLYRLLQVIPEAEPEVIRAAYRALARKHHPDAGGSDAQMAMLNVAWETLRNRETRAEYDRGRKTAAAAPMTQSWQSGPEQRATGRSASPQPMTSRARSGTVLDFGRYAGFSIGELARTDPDYLRWLARTSIGRRLQPEVDAVLTATWPITPRSERPQSLFSRRR